MGCSACFEPLSDQSPAPKLGWPSQSLAPSSVFRAEKLERNPGEGADESATFRGILSAWPATRSGICYDSHAQLIAISPMNCAPLWRVRVGLRSQQQDSPVDDPLWLRLTANATRLDLLIEDILTLSRPDVQDIHPCRF